MTGKILVGEYDGVHVIRFEGDVRVTLTGSFDRYAEAMLADQTFAAALVDLSNAEAIDSTSLGVLAKLSISVTQAQFERPTLVCSNPDILRVLNNMGIQYITTAINGLDAIEKLERPAGFRVFYNVVQRLLEDQEDVPPEIK